MTTKEKEILIKKIKEDLASTQREIQKLLIELEPIAPDCCLGALTREELMIEQEIAEKTLKIAQTKESRLKYALVRSQRKDFGICKECEEDIPIQRLLIIPESTHCVRCMEELGL